MTVNRGSRISIVSILKVLACYLVYTCHVAINVNSAYGYDKSKTWQILFRTPAWGGVWIFFIIGGFLFCNSFSSHKFVLSKQGLIHYYRGRFKSILLPTLVFISIAYIFNATSVNDFKSIPLLKFLVCLYNGIGGIPVIGLTWYVFTTMWLYLLAPALFLIVSKIRTRYHEKLKIDVILLLVVMIIGCLLRVIFRLCNLDWYSWIYTNPIANIDLFASGMLTYFILDDGFEFPNWGKVLSAILLVALIVANQSMYFYGEERGIPFFITLYRYLYPSLYCLVIALVLISFGRLRTGKNKVLHIIDAASNYTFAFYLWHAWVLSRIVLLWQSSLRPSVTMALCYILGIVISAYCAVLYNHIIISFNRIEKKEI